MDLGRETTRFPLLASLAIVLPAVAATIIGVTPFFETNDDPWTMLTLSGRAISPEPTEYAIFMNIYLSRAIAMLYRLAGDVPWYGLTMIGSVTAALAAMVYAILIGSLSLRRLPLIVICLAFCGLPFVVMLQFTRVAFMAGLGGVFLLYAAIASHCAGGVPRSWTAGRLLAASLLLAQAFMIRKESLYVVLLLSIPLLLHLIWRVRRARATKLLLATLAGIGLLLAALGYGHFRTYDQDPEWRRFNEINRLKSWFVDWQWVRYSEDTKHIFEDVGWSHNDYLMMMRWFYVDPEIYSLENLETITAHFSAAGSVELPALVLGVRTVVWAMRGDEFLWAATPLILGIVLLGVRGGDRWRVLVWTAMIAFGVLVGFIAFLKLQPRIYHPTVLSVVWFALLLSQDRARSSHRALHAIGLILMVASIPLMLSLKSAPIHGLILRSRHVVEANRDLRVSLLRLAPRATETYVSWGGSFPYEYTLPLESTAYLKDLRIVMLGFVNGSPLQREMMAAQGISDLPRSLFARDDVLIFSRAPRDHPLLETYIEEHYGATVELENRFDSPSLSVWQVVLQSEAPSQK